eukprot:359258-Chlamydomonas_euryale.AAC.2
MASLRQVATDHASSFQWFASMASHDCVGQIPVCSSQRAYSKAVDAKRCEEQVAATQRYCNSCGCCTSCQPVH